MTGQEVIPIIDLSGFTAGDPVSSEGVVEAEVHQAAAQIAAQIARTGNLYNSSTRYAIWLATWSSSVFLVGQRPIIVCQLLARSIAEGRPQMRDGIAMTLSANFDISFPREATRMHHRMAFRGVGMRLVIANMLRAWTVTTLTRNTQHIVFTPILVGHAGHVVKPGVVALQTPRG